MRMAKRYSQLRVRQHNAFHKRLCEIAQCRDEALAELEAVDPKLYAAALVLDDALFPIRAKPPTETPSPDDVGTAFDPAAMARDQANK
jgi:hypothetical protein